MAGLIEDEAGHAPSRGFAGGYHLETIPLGFAVFGAVMMPGPWGKEYARDIEKYTHFAGMWICGEDLPQAKNRITRDTAKKGKFRLAFPHVHYDDHASMTSGCAITRLLKAARSTSRWAQRKSTRRRHSPRATTWAVAALSERPEDGVCNKWGQSHEIPNLFISDGSQFSTSAAPNPTLTIVALTIRQADYIADQMAKRAI